MIQPNRLQEFGFTDIEKFPQRLCQHAVTLTLPTAIEHGVPPLELIIEDGLVIPMQDSGNGGMIILSDGTMLYVAHRDLADPASPLESRFIKEIPYDLRSSVSNIMQRAVQVDPSLSGLWDKVKGVWVSWFPPSEADAGLVLSGEYDDLSKVWNAVNEILTRWTDQASQESFNLSRVRVRISVQSDDDFKQGWLGEEIVADETALRSVHQQGMVKYLLQQLFPRLQEVLRSPMFSPASSFRLYYSARAIYSIRIVVVPRSDATSDMAGIEFTLQDVEGNSPAAG